MLRYFVQKQTANIDTFPRNDGKSASHPELDSGSGIYKNLTTMTKLFVKKERFFAPLRMSRASKNNDGFTLAEVLITLGIIGIVAALTLPSLIVKYQKQQTAVKVKKTYSEMTQAIKLSEVENGEFGTWDFYEGDAPKTSRKFMKEYLLPYLKGERFISEGSDKSFGSAVSFAGQNYLLANGVGISLVSHDGKTVYFVVDVNGPRKPNLNGADAFYFNINEKGEIIPYEWDENKTREEIMNGYIDSITGARVACKMPPDGTDIYTDLNAQYYLYLCTALLMYDGWEIKDDYPWIR